MAEASSGLASARMPLARYQSLTPSSADTLIAGRVRGHEHVARRQPRLECSEPTELDYCSDPRPAPEMREVARHRRAESDFDRVASAGVRHEPPIGPAVLLGRVEGSPRIARGRAQSRNSPTISSASGSSDSAMRSILRSAEASISRYTPAVYFHR